MSERKRKSMGECFVTPSILNHSDNDKFIIMDCKTDIPYLKSSCNIVIQNQKESDNNENI